VKQVHQLLLQKLDVSTLCHIDLHFYPRLNGELGAEKPSVDNVGDVLGYLHCPGHIVFNLETLAKFKGIDDFLR